MSEYDKGFRAGFRAGTNFAFEYMLKNARKEQSHVIKNSRIGRKRKL